MNTVINKMPDKKECEHDYRVFQTAPYDYCLVCNICQLYKKTMTDHEVIDYLIERNGLLKSQLREQKPDASYTKEQMQHAMMFGASQYKKYHYVDTKDEAEYFEQINYNL